MPAMPSTRLLLFTACLVLSACGKTDAPSGPGGPGQGRGGDRPLPVTVEVVREQPWQDTVKALGTARARESVNVTAKVSETVQRVHFSDGDAVARGAPLVTLSGAQQQAQLQAAQANAREAEQLFRRQQQLASQQLISRAMFDQQKATRDAALAQVAQIRANLADRVIRAPFAGVLGMRQVSPGALVTPGTVIATLDDIARVHVDFPVPERQLAGIAPGQAVTGTTAAWPEVRFDGTVATVDSRVDAGSRSVTVRADFPNPDRRLKPGMLVDVALARGAAQALVVPEIAVQQVGSETFVWRVAADGSVEKAAIVVGGRVPGKVMVSEGLKPGERIVTEGVGKLKVGSKVAAGGAGSGTPARQDR